MRREKRRQLVAERYRAGLSMREIAELMGVGKTTVARDLASQGVGGSIETVRTPPKSPPGRAAIAEEVPAVNGTVETAPAPTNGSRISAGDNLSDLGTVIRHTDGLYALALKEAANGDRQARAQCERILDRRIKLLTSPSFCSDHVPASDVRERIMEHTDIWAKHVGGTLVRSMARMSGLPEADVAAEVRRIMDDIRHELNALNAG